MRTGLNAGNGKGANGSERRGNDVDQRLISCGEHGFGGEPFNEENHGMGVGIQHRTGHRGAVTV